MLPRSTAGPTSAQGLGACLEDWFAEQFPQAQVPEHLPQWGADSTWVKVGGLPGHCPSVALTFIFLARVDRPGHYRYRLYHCRVAAATGEGLVQESALERVLDDKDFLPDVTLFHQRLTNSLAHLPGRAAKQP